jgi:quinolinate synthase
MEKALDIAKNNLPVKGFLDLKDIQIPQGQDLIDAILKLKKEKKAVILAHYISLVRFKILQIIWEILYN